MIHKHSLVALMAALLFTSLAAAEEVRGTIVRMDADKNELTIEGRGKGIRGLVMRFVLDKDTQILLGRKPGKIADLATGKHVRVVYEVQPGRHKALLLTLPGAAADLFGSGLPLLPPSNPGKTLSAPPVPADPNTVVGVLRRVALTDREMVIISPGPNGQPERETTVAVPEDAKITRDQKPWQFDDLKEGEQVIVQTEKRDGQLVARSVQVGPAAPVPAAPREERRIERFRQVLKTLDNYLQMLERR
jgi:hypothetical protein